MKKRRKGCANNDQQGFTLLEMMVVLFLITLLLAFAGTGLAGYYRYFEWKRQEEYAKTIFLAVQSELTKREQAGQLSDLAALFRPDEKLDVEKLIGENGEAVWSDRLWPGERGAIYILEARGKHGADAESDYERYKQGRLNLEDREDQKICALYQMIEPYMPESSVLSEGTIRIELDPLDGLVYSCFYSSCWPEGFISRGDMVGMISGDRAEKGDISDRTRQARREKQIGYFGAETLSSAGSCQEAPVIRSLMLRREKSLGRGEEGQQLQLSWRIQAEDIRAWKELTYEINLYGTIGEENREGIVKICTVTINPGTQGEEEGYGPVSYDGVPQKLTFLEPEREVQVVQALVEDESGKKDWCCFWIMLDEPRYQITLILDEEEPAQVETSSLSDERRASPSDRKKVISSDSAEGTEPFFFSLHEKLQEKGYDWTLLEWVSCTVVGYGGGHADTLMKKSGREKVYWLEETEEDEERAEE